MKTTREGKRFLIAAFLIAVAALNTGNNLIYLILSLMLALVILSALILKTNFSGLSAAVSATPPVFAGDNAPGTVSITNAKKVIPSYSVALSAEGITEPAYFSLIPPQSTVKRDVRMRFEKRGLWGYGVFRARSGFPFILFTKESSMAMSGEVLVYPALRPIERIIPELAGSEGGGVATVVGSGDEIYSLREFRSGDDRRKIHWKASAKASSLLIREYAEHEFRKATIIVDNLRPEDHDRFEKVVSAAGSLARYFLDAGHLVRVLSCRKVIPFGGGDEQLFTILDILAVIKEEDSWDSPVTDEREGMYVSVLKSPRSAAVAYAAMSDMVVYADTL